jgi:hypothetical protein
MARSWGGRAGGGKDGAEVADRASARGSVAGPGGSHPDMDPQALRQKVAVAGGRSTGVDTPACPASDSPVCMRN